VPEPNQVICPVQRSQHLKAASAEVAAAYIGSSGALRTCGTHVAAAALRAKFGKIFLKIAAVAAGAEQPWDTKHCRAAWGIMVVQLVNSHRQKSTQCACNNARYLALLLAGIPVERICHRSMGAV
jgi:hypothetical protein